MPRKPPIKKQKRGRPTRDQQTINRAQTVARLDDVDYTILKLGEVRADLLACREAGKATALSTLHRLELEVRDRVVAALSAATVDEEVTEAELQQRIHVALRNASPKMRSWVEERLVELRTPPPLAVVTGGKDEEKTG